MLGRCSHPDLVAARAHYDATHDCPISEMIQYLPDTICLGHTPHLQAVAHSPFWAYDDVDIQNSRLPRSHKEFMGVVDHRIEPQYAEMLSQFIDSSALHHYQKLLQYDYDIQYPLLDRIDGSAPTHPNVFSDGGY
eukprot:2760378-Karenia_brevis.AAC.1